MKELRDNEGVSILYITHDLASARYVADRMIVLYAGRIAEEVSPLSDRFAATPLHATADVLSARPAPRADAFEATTWVSHPR